MDAGIILSIVALAIGAAVAVRLNNRKGWGG